MLPRLVEYLLATLKSNKDNLVALGGTQWYVPVLPPNSSQSFQVTPYTGYATIEYRWSVDPTMMPNAWQIASQQVGHFFLSGVIDSAMLRDGSWHWVVILPNKPIITTLTNLTNLNQFWRNNENYITIPNEADYGPFLEALNRLTTKPIEDALKGDVYRLKAALERVS